MVDSLTAVEQNLLDDARRGVLALISDHTPKEIAARDAPEDQVRGEFVRELLLGRHGELDPRGVRLRGARITGEFDLSHIHATVGLVLVRCYVDHEVQLRDTHLPMLALRWTTIPTLFGDGLHVEGSVHLDHGFAASASGTDDAVALNGAHIGGSLALGGARLTSHSGAALAASGIRVGGDVVLDQGFTARSASRDGTVHVAYGQLGGQFLASGARLTNSSGPALHADGLQVATSMFLDNGFTAEGSGDRGTVRLLGAHIRGALYFDDAHVNNPAGPAVGADRLRVEDNLTFNEGFTATTDGVSAAIRLFNARIGGQFTALGASITNTAGPALDAQGMQLEGGLLLQDGFTATGGGDNATLRLSGARITGQLGLLDAGLINSSGPVLDLSDTQATTVWLSDTLCPHQQTSTKSCENGQRTVRLDGFTYVALRTIDWRQWLHIIQCHTTGYGPQPYQHLAALQKAAGHDGDARRVLIAQQEDLQQRGQPGGPITALIHTSWGWLAGYGYRPLRLGLALLVVMALAGVLSWTAGHITTTPGHHAAEHTRTSARPGTPCSTVELVGLGIDRGLPLGSTGIRDRCDLVTDTVAGQWFTVSIWVLQGVLWALVTLAVAGYTSLIRKIT